jgi:hypothetical protein
MTSDLCVKDLGTVWRASIIDLDLRLTHLAACLKQNNPYTNVDSELNL